MPKYTLDDVRKEYYRLDALCGVDTSYLDLRISTRATSRYGYCHYTRKGGRLIPDYISITDFIFECEDQFWNTVRHEYAHALVTIRTGRAHHHDNVWKAACREIGCKPERLAKDEDAHAKSAKLKEEKLRYEVHCNSCGRVFKYMKAGPVVKALQAGSKTCTCPCGSHDFELINLI
jgi:predicted SprT family Zn-dependent metalloprotease